VFLSLCDVMSCSELAIHAMRSIDFIAHNRGSQGSVSQFYLLM
jgi:hypothetical protein